MYLNRLTPSLRCVTPKRLPSIPSRYLTTPSPPSPALRPCPKCHAPLSPTTTPCPHCSTLLPFPPGLSHHSLLGLSQPIPANAAFSSPFDIPLELSQLPAHGFEVDKRDLRNRMLGRQKGLHPDKFGGGEVGELAKGLSGRVNEAYGVLVDPLKRVEYILSTHSLALEETESLTDPMLLAEIMEVREELDEATSEDQVTELRKSNHDKVEATIASIKEAFEADPPNLAGAKILSVQLKYWQGLEDAAREWSPKQ